MNTSETIYYIRSAIGFTQKEMGDLVGITGKAWSHYETGIRKPSLDSAKKILGVAKDYGVKPVDSKSPNDWRLEHIYG